MSDPASTRRRFLVGAAVTALGVTAIPSRGRAAAERTWFDAPFGAWVAGDMPRAYEIGGGRTMWVTNDSYLTRRPDASGLDDASFVRNAAFAEMAQRLTVMHQPDRPFLARESNPLDEWWWFHGGVTVADRLHCFVTAMRRTGPRGWAINFAYEQTWIATFSTSDWRLTDLRAAPNAGTRPVYGFAVASDARHTYLFGNTAQYGDGTTENFVARVPLGRVFEAPTYWDGVRWSPDAGDAVSFHTAGDYAYRLHVFRHGRRWLATCKVDEFFGTEVHVLEASQPTGPWRVISRLTVPTVTGDERTCTYDAQALPDRSGAVRLWWSNNAFTEADVRADPSRYRPRTMLLDI